MRLGGRSGWCEEFKGWWPSLSAAYRSVWGTAGGCAELTDFGVRFLGVTFSKFPALAGDAHGHSSVVGERLAYPP